MISGLQPLLQDVRDPSRDRHLHHVLPVRDGGPPGPQVHHRRGPRADQLQEVQVRDNGEQIIVVGSYLSRVNIFARLKGDLSAFTILDLIFTEPVV